MRETFDDAVYLRLNTLNHLNALLLVFVEEGVTGGGV